MALERLARLDLPAEAFPVVMELFELDDLTLDRPLWRGVIEPYQPLAVPGFGRPTRARVRLATGHTHIFPALEPPEDTADDDPRT